MQDPVTFIASDWGSFNGAIRTMEKIEGRAMPTQDRSLEAVQREKNAHETFSMIGISAQLEEMAALGHFCVPREKALKQREKFFKDVAFRDFETVLREAQEMKFL